MCLDDLVRLELGCLLSLHIVHRVGQTVAAALADTETNAERTTREKMQMRGGEMRVSTRVGRLQVEGMTGWLDAPAQRGGIRTGRAGWR